MLAQQQQHLSDTRKDGIQKGRGCASGTVHVGNFVLSTRLVSIWIFQIRDRWTEPDPCAHTRHASPHSRFSYQIAIFPCSRNWTSIQCSWGAATTYRSDRLPTDRLGTATLNPFQPRTLHRISLRTNT